MRKRIPARVFNKWARIARQWIREGGLDFDAFDRWARVEAFSDGTRLDWIAPLSSWARRSWDVWLQQVELGTLR